MMLLSTNSKEKGAEGMRRNFESDFHAFFTSDITIVDNVKMLFGIL